MSSAVGFRHQKLPPSFNVNRTISQFSEKGDIDACVQTYHRALEKGSYDFKTFQIMIGVLRNYHGACRGQKNFVGCEWASRQIGTVVTKMNLMFPPLSRRSDTTAMNRHLETQNDSIPPHQYTSAVGIPVRAQPRPGERAGNPSALSDNALREEINITKQMGELDKEGRYEESWTLYRETTRAGKDLTVVFFGSCMKRLNDQLVDVVDESLNRFLFSRALEVHEDAKRNGLLGDLHAQIETEFQKIISKLERWGYKQLISTEEIGKILKKIEESRV